MTNRLSLINSRDSRDSAKCFCDRLADRADSIPSLITLARIRTAVSKMQYDTAILNTDPDVVER